MNIRHLEIFKSVCLHKTITEAAKQLYISQPAVSKTISELEESLNLKLFDRHGKTLVLNESGILFLEKTNVLLELYYELKSSAASIEENSTIKIGSSITIAKNILSLVIKEFNSYYENTPIEVIVDNAQNIKKLLIDNQIDLALIEGTTSNPLLVSETFSSYELIAIASKDNMIIKENKIDLNRLLKEPLLLREQGSAIRDHFDSILLLNNLEIKPSWTSVNSQSLIQATLSNLGVSILPRILVKKHLQSKELIELNINNFNLVVSNNIVYHQEKYQSKPFKKFIEITKKNKHLK